jgi:Na+-transporting NADH:ubiquinone oxidoreductase subunit NqrA
VRIGTESIGRDIAQVISRTDRSRASFTIIGDSDQVVSIAVPQTVSLLRLSGDGEVEFSTVTSLSGSSLGASRLIATPDGTGSLAFNVGGQVQPTPATVSGDYAGVLIVAVQYN